MSAFVREFRMLRLPGLNERFTVMARHWLSSFNTRLNSLKTTIHIHVVMHVLTFMHKSVSIKRTLLAE